MHRRLCMLAALCVLLVPALACGAGGDDNRTYPLPRCGMKIELGSHFTQTQSGPEVYAFQTARDGSIQIEITPAPPGDPAIARQPATFLPAASYDYQRAGTIAGFSAYEARTQAPLGNQIQARWGAAIDTSSGICHLRVTSVWTEGPDQMGERFWSALHDRWLKPL